MVRTIDQDARRRDIVDAVWRLLERGGVEAASVRGVAAEAGLSAGSVRHFFGTQAELHRFALHALTERVAGRIRAAAEEPDLRRRVLAMLGELVPLRADTNRELGVWLEFVHFARHDPALAEVVREQSLQMRRFLRHVAEGLHELGHLPGGADLDRAAAGLHVLVDGLAFELLACPDLLSVAEAEALLEQHVFGEETR